MVQNKEARFLWPTVYISFADGTQANSDAGKKMASEIEDVRDKLDKL